MSAMLIWVMMSLFALSSSSLSAQAQEMRSSVELYVQTQRQVGSPVRFGNLKARRDSTRSKRQSMASPRALRSRVQSGWVRITPHLVRMRRAFDHLYVRFDPLGSPREVWIADVTYRHARPTQRDRSMSSVFERERFSHLSKAYLEIADAKLQSARPDSNLVVTSHLPIRTGIFCREQVSGLWRYRGPRIHLHVAQNEARALGTLFHRCAEHKCVIHHDLVEVYEVDDGYQVSVTINHAVSNVFNSRERGADRSSHTLTDIHPSMRRISSDEVLKDHIYLVLKRSNPVITRSESEAVFHAEVAPHLQRREYVASSHISTTPFIAASNVILNAPYAKKLYEAEQLNTVEELTLGFSVDYIVQSLLVDSLAGSGAVAMMGEALSGGVSLMIFAALEYLMTGSVDPSTFVGGVAMTMGSMAGAYGLFAIASTYGVAGTGVMIGKLSGIAATNATLAWLGGGTIASGGWGMAAGSIIFSGVTLGLGAVVALGSKFAYDQWSAHDRSRFQSGVLRAVIATPFSLRRLTGGQALE